MGIVVAGTRHAVRGILAHELVETSEPVSLGMLRSEQPTVLMLECPRPYNFAGIVKHQVVTLSFGEIRRTPFDTKLEGTVLIGLQIGITGADDIVNNVGSDTFILPEIVPQTVRPRSIGISNPGQREIAGADGPLFKSDARSG